MPQGLQAWGENGFLTVDITDRLTTMLGAVQVGGDPGAIGVPGAGQGQQVWGCFVAQNNNPSYVANDALPRFYVEGDVIRWDWAVGNGITKAGGTLFYGRY